MLRRQQQQSRVHVITSFFVVRALAGAFSPFGGALFSAQQQQQQHRQGAASDDAFLSRVSDAVIQRARNGQQQMQSESTLDQAVDAAAERQLEYLYCLLMNLHSPFVHRVLLLVQDAPSAELLSDVMSGIPAFRAKRDKLVPLMFQPRVVAAGTSQQQQRQQQQPHYRDLFAAARTLLHPTRDIAAVCNSDIHFNTKSLVDAERGAAQQLRDLLMTEHHDNRGAIGSDAAAKETVLALTRYEECGEHDSFFSNATAAARDGTKEASPLAIQVPTGDWWSDAFVPRAVDATHAPLIDDYRGSHDCFVFRPRALSNSAFLRAVDHPQNAYQSENIVIHEIERCGAVGRVINPSKGVFRVAHRHASDVRQWFPPVDAPAADGAGTPERYGKAPPSP
jgi:hypothetical protein